MKCNPALFSIITISLFFMSCAGAKKNEQISSNKYISQLEDSLAGGHLGICIFDADHNKYLVEYNDRKYFTPASNMKLFTCYAAMKYLGDSLVGMRYFKAADTLYLLPTADPTLRSRHFKKDPVADFLILNEMPVAITDFFWKSSKYGKGWAWDDYMEDFMPERSPMPAYDNVSKIEFRRYDYEKQLNIPQEDSNDYVPMYGMDSYPSFGGKVRYYQDSSIQDVIIKRALDADSFTLWFPFRPTYKRYSMPFVTNGLKAAANILGKANWKISNFSSTVLNHSFSIIHSQPTDSLLKPMMHRSDNFFAEQTLLMVSNEKLGYMSDDKIIDTLLKTDLKDIPDQPVWVDGSGLSRYNLVTPRDFVWLLNKMKTEFSFERIKNILPTGGEGTLLHYYNQDSGFIYAKTGTLGGQVAISGYLITNAGKTLIFSVLVNNHNGSASAIRRQVEAYLTAVRKKY